MFAIIIAIILVGFLLWLANTYIPMDEKVRSFLSVIIIVVLVFWVVQRLGIISMLGGL